ncbi:hypothetical protein TEK04_10190 [Klenkia sp. LSe6-5]|uniref:Uncharacterized protein n=1 Tax=Klenkia sesuvii TaxID=3103137 RepID=A0ABU8DTA7_9ACTN
MRWEQLFAELEAAFEAEESAVEQAEAGSRARAAAGTLRLVDRLRGASGHQLVLDCRGAGVVRGRLVDVGVDWVLLTDERGRDLLVALAAVQSVSGLGALTAPPEDDGVVARAWDLRRAVRGLVRDRAPVQLLLDGGSALAGTLDRVGADFVELAEHHLDEPRRRGAVRAVRAVALAAVAVVVSVTPGGA